MRHVRTAQDSQARTGWSSDAGEKTVASFTWRLRIRMDDRPGTLARVAIRLADLECNILGLTVLPVPGGVLDEIVVRPATGLTRQHLVAAIRAEGCECSGIVDADVRELVDASAASLSSASRAVGDPAKFSEVLREVLAADVVTVVPADETNPSRTEGGHRAVFPIDAESALVARRGWAPFVQLELARGKALLGLFEAVRANVPGPVVMTCSDGANLVLRQGAPGDADAVFALHGRCSKTTLSQRYHAGMRTVPRRWLHRLLVPPRGISLLAVCGREVVALGQLIPVSTGQIAEVSLLVEDSWQRKGVGTALLARLGVLAGARGHRELTAVCLPGKGKDTIFRTAMRAGLTPEKPAEGESLVRIPLA